MAVVKNSINKGGGVPSLQEVGDVGSIFNKTIGDFTHIFNIYDFGTFVSEIANSVTGDFSVITQSSSTFVFAIRNLDKISRLILDNNNQDGIWLETYRGSTNNRFIVPFHEGTNKNCFFYLPNNKLSGNYTIALQALVQTSDFTAQNNTPYSTNGTITVTDPTPINNQGYIVHVIGGTTTIGGVGYTAGALVYRFYNGTEWISTDVNNSTSASRSTSTSGTESAPDTTSEVIFIHEAGATASLTYNFPPNPIDKQKVTIMSVGGITSLTLSATAGTIVNTITTLVGGGCATYMYLASQTKWYKIG